MTVFITSIVLLIIGFLFVVNYIGEDSTIKEWLGKMKAVPMYEPTLDDLKKIFTIGSQIHITIYRSGGYLNDENIPNKKEYEGKDIHNILTNIQIVGWDGDILFYRRLSKVLTDDLEQTRAFITQPSSRYSIESKKSMPQIVESLEIASGNKINVEIADVVIEASIIAITQKRPSGRTIVKEERKASDEVYSLKFDNKLVKLFYDSHTVLNSREMEHQTKMLEDKKASIIGIEQEYLKIIAELDSGNLEEAKAHISSSRVYG